MNKPIDAGAATGRAAAACCAAQLLLLLPLLLLAACGQREAQGPASAPAQQGRALPATANKLYVAPHGDDADLGTEAAPLRTIAAASAKAVPGTTVLVAPGQYAGGFKTTASGSEAARIYFVSTVRWGARIVPPPRSASPTAWDNRGSHVDIVGFDIDGSAWQGGVKWLTGIYNGGSYDVIRNNHVHHIATSAPCTHGGAGIGVDSYYRGVQSDVIGNSVHDIGPAGCRYLHGIYINTPGSVKNNLVYRVAETGIKLWHDANKVIVSNNTIAASGTGIVVGGGDYYYTSGPNDYTKVVNNIVYDNKNGISEQGATGRHNEYRNNLVFQNAMLDWSLRNGLAHSGTIAAAPGFIAYTRSAKGGTPDFRLGRASPALGKGTLEHAHPFDFDGAARSAGGGVDIGAYQQLRSNR